MFFYSIGSTSENPVFHEKKSGEWQRTGEQQASSSYRGQQGDEVRFERRDYHAKGRGDYHARGRGRERSDLFEQERQSGDHYVESRDKRGRGDFRGRGRGKEDHVEQGRGHGSDSRFKHQERGRGRRWDERRDQRGRGDFHGQRREQGRRESIESIQSGSRVEIPELTWGKPPSPVICELTPIASTSQQPMTTTKSPPGNYMTFMNIKLRENGTKRKISDPGI